MASSRWICRAIFAGEETDSRTQHEFIKTADGWTRMDSSSNPQPIAQEFDFLEHKMLRTVRGRRSKTISSISPTLLALFPHRSSASLYSPPSRTVAVRAAGIEKQNAILSSIFGDGCAINHDAESRSLWLEIKSTKIVQHINGNAAHFDDFSLGQTARHAGCRRCANRGYGRYLRKRCEDSGAPTSPHAEYNPTRATLRLPADAAIRECRRLHRQELRSHSSQISCPDAHRRSPMI